MGSGSSRNRGNASGGGSASGAAATEPARSGGATSSSGGFTADGRIDWDWLDAWLADYLAALPRPDPIEEEEEEVVEGGGGTAGSGVGDAPAGNAPSGDAPAGDAPAGDAPAGDAPAGDAPAGDAPAGDAPAGDAPAGDAPAGDAPAGATPAGDAPAAGGAGDAAGGATPAVGDGSTSNAGPPRLPNLKVSGVKFNVYSNAFAHRTVDYEFNSSVGRDLIVRRGQSFKLSIQLSRPFRPDRERIFLNFSATSKFARPTNGTLVSLDINEKYEADDWNVNVESNEGNTVDVSVKSAADAIVGNYSLTVKVQSKTTSVERTFPQKTKVLVLFNAWCEEDQVFLKDEEERKEYVLEDSGMIWRGAAYSNYPKRWNFGQFDLDVRNVIIELLEDNLRAGDRRNPIKVARKFTHVINEYVLHGRWDNHYEDGTRPSYWKGSVKILEQYTRTKLPVKYGQCWVFSGLLTTFLRCVGIPTRSVTNFDSAHDTEDNLTIDRYVDKDGNKVAGGDSIWNFHVWNEAWMARPDLDPGFGGWQVVDSTPQELSAGLYQCGPSPVLAVKQGMVNVGFDSRFVFSEVNADRLTFELVPDPYFPWDHEVAKHNLIKTEKKATGHQISTKKVGASARNDITLEYKYEEGSKEERAAVLAAVSKGNRRRFYEKEGEPDDVVISISKGDELVVGQDFEITIETKNQSDSRREIFLKTTIDSCYYTGIAKETIKTDKTTLTVGPGESVTSNMRVAANDYLDSFDDEGLFTVFVIGSVKETGKTINNHDVIRLKTPDLEVGATVNGSEVTLKVEFTNPLDRTLTQCEFSVEAPRLVKEFSVQQADIRAGEKVEKEIKFTARTWGKKTVIVEFDCKQLKDIEGEVVVDIIRTGEEETD